MSARLPSSILNYFAGKNTRDFATAVLGFAPSAVVRDESRDRLGPAAIRTWMEETTAQYDDKADVQGASFDADRVGVLALVSGDFAGSPVRLHFNFVIADGQIARLEIVP